MSGSQSVPPPSPVQDSTSAASGGWGGLRGWQKIGAGVAAVAVATGLAMFPGGDSVDERQQQKPPAPQRAEPFQEPASSPVLTTAAAPLSTEVPRPGVATSTRRRPPPPISIAAYVDPQAAQVSPGEGRGPGAPVAQREPASSVPGQPLQVGSAGGGSDAGAVPAASLPLSRATRMRNPDYVIAAGTQIPCLPVEAINSAIPGFTTCRVPEWVRGTTQRRGVLPPGTLIFGQMRTGLSQGQRRLGVLYTRIQTAGDNFTVALQAPAADAMGRAGLSGDVETFFWDQVGAVALYSLIQGIPNALQAGISAAAGNNGTSNFFQFGGAGQSLAGTALQHQLNRTPELQRDQALPSVVFVGQDLDFHDVCRERAAAGSLACPLM